jgi:probable DNA metabolism protein
METPFAEYPLGESVVYDGTFDGLLCVVDRALRLERLPLTVDRGAGKVQGGLFGAVEQVPTDARIAADLEERLARSERGRALRLLYRVVLSEQPGCDRIAVRLGLALLRYGTSVLDDVGFEPAFEGQRLSRMVGREVHRMHAFVRFSDAVEVDGEERYVAFVEPECDVLPLIGAHFKRRFPAMRWTILDTRRRYGLVWNGTALRIADDLPEALWRQAAAPRATESERLWRAYFRSVDVPERRNPDLQRRHMPKRYWRYLPEATEIRGR